MSRNMVITIGRESGSAGRAIGKKVSEKLGISFYDHELLDIAAKDSGICHDVFVAHDEKPTNSFLYSLVMDTYSAGYTTSGYIDMPLNQKVFLAQFETIKKLADQESCVIVGRCADYALSDHPNKTSIYITADYDDKIKHLMETYKIETPNKAKDFMNKRDKQRSSYYNYYSNGKWGSAKTYDLCINRSRLGMDGTVEAILMYIDLKKRLNKES